MPLSIGNRLGPYEILAPIGAGGMGEVYRACDTTLKRDVALKVLPAAFLRDPERMARFQREAQVLASLDHPNIGHIYGIVDSEDSRGLVLALIEGPTLADRIAAGPIPLEETLAISKQIVEALEYAHERGIVHRDLKPANIKITSEGVVKVLDFGLAKVLEDEPPISSLADSPTLTLGHTRAGMILGTAAYMSPEQAVGRPVDRRSDIFSFGAVLYEMLSGKRAFTGATTPDVLEAVVKNDPDWSKLPVETPESVRKLLRRCLTKDRKQRLQAIGEARIILNNPSEGGTGPNLPAKTNNLPWAVAALLALTTAIVLALWAPWRAASLRPLVRLEVDLGADVALNPTAGQGDVILSPDGTRLAYVASVAGGPARLYVRRLDQANAVELPGTDGALRLFFSPDSQWIGFFTGKAIRGKVSKISVNGGAVVPLGDSENAASADWGEDGTILLSGNQDRGLSRIPPSGGQRIKVTDLAKGETSNGSPQILPGGKAALFTARGAGMQTIEAVSLANGKRKVVVQGGAFPRYLPSGHLIYVNNGTLFAVPFDPDKLETRGNPVPILDGIKSNPANGGADLSFSRNGTLVYREGGVQGILVAPQSTVEWIDAAGKRSPLLAKAGLYSDFRLSPDGKLLALAINGATPGAARVPDDIWVYDPRRDTLTKLTFAGGGTPVWSPDGQYIIFRSSDGGVSSVRADGAGQPHTLLDSKNYCAPSSFSPDGKRLACYRATPSSGGSQILTVPVTEESGQLKAGTPELFFESKFPNVWPEFSPDGKWLAYMTNESGRQEVEVRPFPPPASGQGGKWQISNSGGDLPKWSRKSRELLYSTGNQLMAVSYTVNGNTFLADKPRVRVEKIEGIGWDLAPDGRIAALAPVETTQAAAPAPDHTVVFLMNFFDELRRRVPAGK